MKRIPITTAKGTFSVWTKRIGNNPRIKVLLLHGGPGATHEYMEAFDSYLPGAGVEYYHYDQLGSAFSDQPKDPSLWDIPRFVEEVEQLAVGVKERLSLAVGLYQQGRGEEAIGLLEQLAEEGPRQVAVWVLLGQLYREKGRALQAERVFIEVITLNPENVDGWFGLGMLRSHARPAAAAQAFREAIKDVPGVTGATLKAKVSSAEVAGDFDAAELVKALNKAGFHVKVKQ